MWEEMQGLQSLLKCYHTINAKLVKYTAFNFEKYLKSGSGRSGKQAKYGARMMFLGRMTELVNG